MVVSVAGPSGWLATRPATRSLWYSNSVRFY
jgi:hypothetical protein